MPDDALTDRIYEAAFNPDEWPSVLDDLAALAGAAGGCVAVLNGYEPLGARQSEAVREVGARATANPEPGTVLRFGYACANPEPGFLASSAFFPKEMLEADALVQMKLQSGLAEEVFTIIPMPGGEIAMFSIDRQTGNGPFRAEEIERLNRLHPHLARAALVAARLGLERAQAAVSALAALGVPAAALSRNGRVVVGNALLDDLADTLLPVAFGGMAIAHAPANRLFQEAIARGRGAHDGVVRSIPVPARDGEPALVVHVLPLRRSAHDIFSGADILVAATSVSASRLVPSPSVLTGLFDLTPAEVKLASALAAGRSLKMAAQDGGIRFSTARSYLEHIFRKTGTHRQSELVALLKSAQPVRSA